MQTTDAGGTPVDRPVRLDPERAAFEEWQSDAGRWPKAVERDGEGYKLAASQAAWTAWRAGWVRARNAECERCAALVEPKNDPSDWTEYAHACADLARRIRSKA